MSYTETRKIFKTGGSDSITIPAKTMDKWGNPQEIELEIDDHYIIIRPHINGESTKGA